MKRSQYAVGLALAMLGAIGFSGKAIIIKLAYQHGAAVDPVTLLMWRMLLALPLFLLVAWWASRGQAPLSRRDWLDLFVLGFSGYYLASFLDFAGLQHITASLERLILYLNPTLVLLISVVTLRTKVAGRQWAALALSYAGVLIVFAHEVRFDGGNTVWGSLLVLASAISYAIYLVRSGEVLKRLGVLRLTGWATSIACVLCIGQFLLLRPLQAAWLPEPVLWLSLLNATACTFLPVLCVAAAIQRIGAPLASQAGLIGPMSTLLLATWLLGEPFNAWVLAGTVLVLSGVAWLAWRR
jgi:drug/metabolite transporter (DMT)-like permease